MGHQPTCWLIHGFNVRDNGANTVDKLGPHFAARGYRIGQFDYGWTFLLGARFGNKQRAERLAALVQPGDIAVGHSNGCTIIHYATTIFKAALRCLVYVNPALDCDAEPAEHVESVHVWHSPSDAAVRAASVIPFVSWGMMGASGYTGADPRVVNFDKENDFDLSSREHSDVFSPRLVTYFGSRMAQMVPRASLEIA